MSFSRIAVFALSLGTVLHAADTRLVRETEALTPAEEQAKLHVPAGFDIQLFASEPMINKPINLAFDARGRLWVSSTVEYPYSAKRERWADDQGTRVEGSRDAIKILSDTDGDGRADKVTDFADGLNIPTGVLPWHKPEHKAGCIAWSIPNIWYFADTDGDDIADVREVLFGPLGYEKDTHGMCSSFRLGLDGWVYATHGFNNTSHFEVKAERWQGAEKMTHASSPDFGRRLELHSGNVFRFNPDGSRVEPWTWGQVNPFGLCWDRYGNLYSADCHSSPIYQLIRGAHYPSFGKPHAGLGFAPVMCEHSHGSTGICGIVYLDGGVWGPQWDDHTFVGNVVTSCINHDKITFTGSTPKANEEPDFLTSDDPWFRPVDLQLGPDNALYIADFYNKIIGHYEVPLEHPGRDKERGRIWRVVKSQRTKPLTDTNLEALPDAQLALELESENLTRRFLAGQLLYQRGDAAVAAVLPEKQEGSPTLESAARRFAHGLWLEARLGKAGHTQFSRALQADDFTAAHAFKALNAFQGVPGVPGYFAQTRMQGDFGSPGGGSIGTISYVIESYSLERAADNSYVSTHASAEKQKAKTECLGASEDRAAIQELETLLQRAVREHDLTLSQTAKVALRQILSLPGSFKAVPPDIGSLTEIALSVPNAEASAWLWRTETLTAAPSPARSQAVRHIARHGAPELLHSALMQVRETAKKASIISQMEMVQAIHEGLSERGAPANGGLLAWAQELAIQLLEITQNQSDPTWTALGAADSAPKWAVRPRACADGTEALVLQSIGGGGEDEKRTGVLRSKAFTAPIKLTFWINGHRGFPKTPAHDKNLVRIVDVKDDATLASVFPPRNDVCQRSEIDLAAHAGKPVRLEIVDGDDGKAYAWLGITRIEPAVIRVDDFRDESSTRSALKTLAVMLQHTAPAGLRDKLAAYLPPRPAPPPLPVSREQRKLLDAQIAARVESYAKRKPQAQNGEKVFKAHCAACHQMGGGGGLIGPQLDGIGARGPERLCEDILDPNRNVDAHFHLHTLTLKNGTRMSGFLKAEAGQVLILADAAGQEQRVSKNDVTKDETVPMSLMPPVFGQTLGSDDFSDLLGYLLSRAPVPVH